MNPGRTPAQFAFFALLAHAAPAYAIEMAMSHRGLVTDSDVIVVATLQNTSAETKYGMLVEDGMLRVEQVVCGDVRMGDILHLRWSNFPNVACPTVHHAGQAGRSRLWFLKRGKDGVYHADTEQRAWPVEELETFIDTLAVYPYHIVTPRYDIGEPVIVTVEFRNATTSPLSVPTIRVADGRVTFSQGFKLVLHPRYSMGVESPVILQSDALELDDSLERTTLGPGEVSRVELPFSSILAEIPIGLYRFDVRVDGGCTSHGVRVQSAWETALDRVRDTPSEIPYYIQTLRTGAPESGAALMMLQLKRTETSGFADELMSLCDSLEAGTRWELMRMIRWLDVPTETQMDFFLDRINDPIPEVRSCAAGGIGQLVQPGAYRRDEGVAFLLTLLDEEDPNMRRSAIGTVSNARVSEGLPSLKIIARYDPDEETRRSAWWAIDVLEGRRPCKDRRIEKRYSWLPR